MAKPFSKQPVHWLNLQSTSDYLNELTKLRNRSLTDLVQVTKGGSNPGTWMHEDVALEFLPDICWCPFFVSKQAAKPTLFFLCETVTKT